MTDSLGSPRMLVDADTGAVVGTRTYGPWGAVESETGGWVIPLGFAGGLRDEDTGLVHFGAREFGPEAGPADLSKDPMKAAGVLDAHEYPGGATRSTAPTSTVSSWWPTSADVVGSRPDNPRPVAMQRTEGPGARHSAGLRGRRGASR